MPGGRTGCRGPAAVDEVARAAAASPRLRLVGVAGYEAALGHDIAPDALAGVTGYLQEMRAAVVRLAPLFEADRVIVTAGGSTYFDAVADVLTGTGPPDWRCARSCVAARTSPMTTGCTRGRRRFVPRCCLRCRYGPRWCRVRSPGWRC